MRGKAILICVCFFVLISSIGIYIKQIYEKRIVAEVIAAEACGEGYKGMVAVASVISNRAKIKRKTFYQIATQKRQFFGYTAKNRTKLYKEVKEKVDEIVDLLYSGKLKDTVNGATHFENIKLYGTPK